MQHYNNPANIAHADMIIDHLAEHGITLDVIINHWDLKQVIISHPDGRIRIANLASFNSFWHDVDVITDADTLAYIKKEFGIDLSKSALNDESTKVKTNKGQPMQIDIELLRAYNAYDRTIESIRDIELSVLKENRYRLTDSEYSQQYEKIYNKFESKMYRKWANKDLIITK